MCVVFPFFENDQTDGHDRQQRCERNYSFQKTLAPVKQDRDCQQDEHPLGGSRVEALEESTKNIAEHPADNRSHDDRYGNSRELPGNVDALAGVDADQNAVDHDDEHVIDR